MYLSLQLNVKGGWKRANHLNMLSTFCFDKLFSQKCFSKRVFWLFNKSEYMNMTDDINESVLLIYLNVIRSII